MRARFERFISVSETEIQKEMMKRVAPPPPKPIVNRARVLSDADLPATGFRETLRHMEESQEVNKNASLLSMYDDIMNQMTKTKAERDELQNYVLTLAGKTQKLQKAYKKLEADGLSDRSRVLQLQKELLTATTQMKYNSKIVVNLETENAALRAENAELEDVVELCKEVILENSESQMGAMGPEKKQRLIRAVSRQKSMKRRPIPHNRVIHETFEDDSQFDMLDDSELIDRTTEDNLDCDMLNSSRYLADTSINSRKRQMSSHHRRRSAEKETVPQETDSFWHVKTPVRAKLKMSSLTSPATMGKSPSFVAHSWEKRSIHNPITKECEICGKKIKFASEAYKCKTCKMAVHSQCRYDCKIVCLVQGTVISTKRPLIEYVWNRNQHPLIPQFVYQAVHEVDARILEEGIYRISGTAREVNELKKKMLTGEVTTQSLKLITDTNVICSTLKDFFRNMINQPLLTWSAMPSFIQAYKDENTSMLKELFAELPDAHRDTFAFMLIHLIQVSQRSDQNRMTLEALSKSVGPSLIGFVTDVPDANQIQEAATYQHGLLKALLNLGSAFFEKFMKGDNETATSPVSSFATTCVTNHSYDAFGDIKMTHATQNTINKSMLGGGVRKSNNKKLFS